MNNDPIIKINPKTLCDLFGLDHRLVQRLDVELVHGLAYVNVKFVFPASTSNLTNND